MSDLLIRYDQSQDAAFSEAMAQRARMDSMLQQQAEARQRAIMQELQQKEKLAEIIDYNTLNKNLEAEVANSSIAALQNNVANYIKTNPGSTVSSQYSYAQGELRKIYELNSRIKGIKEKIENQFKDVKGDAVSVNNWKNAAITDALFKKMPNGNRVLKSFEELDTETDYASKAWDENGYSFLRLPELQSGITKGLNELPKEKTKISKTIGATRTKPGEKKEFYIDIPTAFQWDEGTGKLVVKKGKDGMIDEQVYTMFAGGSKSPNDTYFSKITTDQIMQDPEAAAEIFDADGKIINQIKFDKAKKNVVAGYLEKFAPKVEAEITQQMPAKNQITVNTGGNSNVGSDWMKEMETVWATGDATKISKKLRTLYSGGTKLETIGYDGVNIVAKFKSGSKDPITQEPLPAEVIIPASDPDALTKIAGLYQTARGSDKGVEGFVDKKIKVF
jgi:hypothetical protein